MKKPFKFKEFQIDQDRCAMKVGTDGVLLGTWASLDHQPSFILDIGAGTGLIALMIAQRSKDSETSVDIDAIEIDADAYEQCVENLESSPWSNRLFCYHAGLNEFTEEIEDQYDLIVSNPPFYSEEVSSGNTSRDRARQNQSLPFDELLYGVSKLLDPKGVFSTIIPKKVEASFIALALKFGLYPNRITHVKGNPSSEIKRSLLEFRFHKCKVVPKELIIEIERHQYTEEYVGLTKAFYLRM